MMKFLRGLLVIAGSLLVLLVILVLVLPRFVSTDGVTDRIVAEVERATGADVTLAEAEFGWRGSWRLVVREGRIAGTGSRLAAATGSPNELESYAAHVGELTVVPALLPLLRKQLEVRELILAGESLAVAWGDGEAELGAYRIHLKDLNLDLEAARNPVPAGGAPGESIPADLAFAFSASVDTLVLQGVPYTDLEAHGSFADRTAEVTAWEALRSTGRLTGRLTADYSEDPWGHLNFEAEGRDLPAAALLEPWVPDLGYKLDCLLEMDLAGRCGLRDKATRLRTLDIAGSAAGSEGMLRAGDWLDEVSPYLGDRQDLKDVRFKALEHEFRFVQGRYLVEGLTLTGGETEWRGEGWIVPQGNLAVGLDVRLPAGFTPELGNFSFLANSLRDAEGRINLPLTLSGQVDNPVVGVDMGRLMGR